MKLGFCTHCDYLWQELENPLILIHDKKISNMDSLIKILELALKVTHILLFVDEIFLIVWEW